MLILLVFFFTFHRLSTEILEKIHYQSQVKAKLHTRNEIHAMARLLLMSFRLVTKCGAIVEPIESALRRSKNK
ncbi:hypothetical protein Hdeb2414_s0238g00843861 [Helianthus debilis subsp. tardiflorus]